MIENTFIKILCSIPIILIVMYFIPFLGICLLLFKCFIHSGKKYKTSIILTITGLLLLIPQLISSIIKTFKIETNIPYLNDIINSEIYPKLIEYSKLLITIGIIFTLISVIINKTFNKLGNQLNRGIKSYIEKDIEKDQQIRKENDLIMQEKREKALHTHAVRCPYCGSDNILTSQTGTCKFCRKTIEYKE